MTRIVVPCYNEASRLDGDRFLAFLAHHPQVRFLFVNDGSTDDTLDVLQRLESRNPDQIEVLNLPRNRGKAEAVRQGMLAAMTIRQPPDTSTSAASRPTAIEPVATAGVDGPVPLPRYTGFWDADLATPLEEIPRFIRLLDERPDIDMVFGSRVQLLGRTIVRKTHRHYFGRVLATAVANTLGMPIYDSQCGAKLFRVTPALRHALSRPFFSGWVFDVELLARLKRDYAAAGRALQDAIYELPLNRWEDVHGSKTRPRDAVVALYNLAKIRRVYGTRGRSRHA